MAEPNPKRARKSPAPVRAAPPASLRLPSVAMLEGCQFDLPTPDIKEAMKPLLDAQRRSMFIYLNKKGQRSHRSKDQNGVGYEPRWQGNGQKAKLWSVGELGINVIDVTDEIFAEDYVFKTEPTSGAITICRANGDPFAGYSPLKDGSGVAFYNIAHPFCSSALTKNNDDRPKAGQTGGTGSFNQGMKQAAQNLYAGGIKTQFDFYGWDQNDTFAHYRYEWKYSNREPKDLQLKINSKAAKAKQECDFPILFQTLKFTDGATPEKLDELNAMVAKVFSSMQRIYKFSEADGIVLRSPVGISLYTRSCYKPMLDAVVGHPIEMAQGFLVNCGKRFTAVTYDSGAQLDAQDLASVGGLIMDIPGKGVPGDAGSPIVIYHDEQRKVVLSTAVQRIGDMVISLIDPAGDDDPLVREHRPKLMEHLAGPLLFGKTSPVFGAAGGKLISDMLCAIQCRGMLWALQRELLRTHLRTLHPNDDDMTFQRKLEHEPIVHSGNPRRAAVLAHILDTYQVSIRHDEVHPDVYRTTNLQAAEERACLNIFNGTVPPPKLKDGLRELADFVLGKETQLVCLPVPEDDNLRGAIVPFYHHNEGINVHQAVMWDGDTSAHYVKSICKLAVVGIQTQMVRADAVLDALNDPDCADLDPFYTCIKILDIVRGMDLPEDDDDDMEEEEEDTKRGGRGGGGGGHPTRRRVERGRGVRGRGRGRRRRLGRRRRRRRRRRRGRRRCHGRRGGRRTALRGRNRRARRRRQLRRRHDRDVVVGYGRARRAAPAGPPDAHARQPSAREDGRQHRLRAQGGRRGAGRRSARARELPRAAGGLRVGARAREDAARLRSRHRLTDLVARGQLGRHHDGQRAHGAR